MNRLAGFLWIALRIGLFWLSVYGFGSLLQQFLKRNNTRIPVHFAGLLALLALSIPLSLVGLFHRPTLVILVLSGAVIGVLEVFKSGNPLKYFRLHSLKTLSLIVLALFIFLSNIFRASIPHTNPDALITYAVQPDRWLSSGTIHYIEEIKFSGFPMTGEILAAWPASLSSSPTDQLSMLQVFQMSMLLLTCIAAWRSLGKGINGLSIVVIGCMGTSMLAGWASLPKIEMTVLYFSTIAFSTIYRRYSESSKEFDPIPPLAMGLALGTKLTAYVLLPSFLLLLLALPEYRRISRIPVWIALLAAVPIIFGLRTFSNTGSPSYPYSNPVFKADDAHYLVEVPEIEELARQNAAPTDLLVNREPEPFLNNVSKLASSWGLPALLFLLGIASLALRKRLSSALLPLGAVVIYLVLASVVFNPLRWGAKYAFLLSPFMASLGTSWSRGLKQPRIFLYAFLLLVILTSSLKGRFSYTLNFITTSDPLDFRPPNIVLVRDLHEWCNMNLPQGTRLLSLWKRERYFSDHTVLVLENHPIGRRLLLTDNLEDEMELLSMMNIDYLYFQTADPMPGDLEDRLLILHSDRLEYIIEVSGFTLCRILY